MKDDLIKSIEIKEDFVLIRNRFIDLGKVTHVDIFNPPPHEGKYCFDPFNPCRPIRYDAKIDIFFLGGSNVQIRIDSLSTKENEGSLERHKEAQENFNSIIAFLKKRFDPKVIKINE